MQCITLRATDVEAELIRPIPQICLIFQRFLVDRKTRINVAICYRREGGEGINVVSIDGDLRPRFKSPITIIK